MGLNWYSDDSVVWDTDVFVAMKYEIDFAVRKVHPSDIV